MTRGYILWDFKIYSKLLYTINKYEGKGKEKQGK